MSDSSVKSCLNVISVFLLFFKTNCEKIFSASGAFETKFRQNLFILNNAAFNIFEFFTAKNEPEAARLISGKVYFQA